MVVSEATAYSAKNSFTLSHPDLRGDCGGRIVVVVDRFEFLQQFFLPRSQSDRGLHHHVTNQVAVRAGTHPLDALAAHAGRPCRSGFRPEP